VAVIETMTRFSTDVIASYAFSINGNSLKDPDAEFMRRLRTIFDFTVRKCLTAMLQFFAPSVLSLIKLKSVDDATKNFITRTVWSTVEYRQG
jgi:cytochrome P450 family 6